MQLSAISMILLTDQQRRQLYANRCTTGVPLTARESTMLKILTADKSKIESGQFNWLARETGDADYALCVFVRKDELTLIGD